MKTLNLVLCALSVFSLAARSDAAQLFGATASGGPGALHRLDPATGASLGNIGPTNDVAGANYPITGLAFHPTTGVLYASTGNNPNTTAGLLLRIDPATAVVTRIGPFNAGPVNSSGTPATMADIAFDAAGNLYGVGSIGGPQLYSINTMTGQATQVGAGSGLTSTSGGGLAINAGGAFYGTPTGSRFGTYDSSTGTYTNIANPDKPGGGGSYAALEFDPAGVLYGLNSAPGSPPPTFLAIINPADGAVTNVGQSVDAIDAIAFRVPEPGTMALVAGVLAGAMARRRRNWRRATLRETPRQSS
jgi:hypothetical protein